MNPSDAVGNQQTKEARKVLQRITRCLKKRSSELSILCGIDLCMVCYMPDDDDDDDDDDDANNPEIWPEDPSRIRDMMRRLESARSSGDVKQTSGVADFLGDNGKLVPKQETMMWRDELDQLSQEELRAFACHLMEKSSSQQMMKEELRAFACHDCHHLTEKSSSQQIAANDGASARSSESTCVRRVPELLEFDILNK